MANLSLLGVAPKSRFQIFWLSLAVVGVGAGLFVLSFKILTPYSYWLDELFSVNASSRGWGELYGFVMSDVHPPLYQIILKFWIILFGAEEVAARSLSWVFSVAALYLTYKMSKKYGDFFLISVLVAIASNSCFSYYGNEVRSYSMLMFCSVWVLFAMPIERSRSVSCLFLLSCLVASWVHYFGLLVAVIAMSYYFLFKIEGIAGRVKVMVGGLVMTFWPLHHIVNGSLVGKSGGRFWIESGGFVDTVRFASSAIIPRDLPFSGFIFFVLMILVFLSLLYLSKNKESANLDSTKLGFQSFAVWGGLIVLVGLIDLHTPMSTGRNFIVTVPFFAVSVAAVVEGVSRTHARGAMVLMAMVIACCAFLLAKSFDEVSRKAQPPEDWRNAIKVALEQSSGKDLYVVQWGGEITDHYMHKFSSAKQVVHEYKVGETKINGPAVIIYARLSPQLLNSLLFEMNASGGQRIFPIGEGKDGNRVGVYIVH